MALKKCSECGNEVSTKAASCPKCGAVIKKKTGCLDYIGAAFLIFIVLGVIGSLMNDGTSTNRRSSSPADGGKSAKTESVRKEGEKSAKTESVRKEREKSAKTESVRKEGESVHVGYTTYAVWRSWWSNHLSENQFLDQRPNAAYLFVELTVRNDDKEARMVPPLKLVDENGAEYEASSNGWAVEGAIGILETLNPSVSKQGFIVFDVPRERSYKMKMSGGYWSSEHAYVQLTPKASR